MRTWWAALALVMAVGAALTITGYDRGLPIYESKDERRNLEEVLILRGQLDKPLWKPGYPPGILAVNAGAQIIAEQITGVPASMCRCTVIRSVRVLNLIINLISPLLLALTARRIAGDGAGLLAPLAWIVSVEVLNQTQYAFPQTYEQMTYLLALLLALVALETRKPIWALWSVVAGLVAVIFKYTAFPVLGLGVGAALWLTRETGRRGLPIMAAQIVLIAACAAWLLFGYDATRLFAAGHREANNLAGAGFAHLLEPSLVAYRFDNWAKQIGMPLVVLVPLLVGGMLITWQRLAVNARLILGAAAGLVLLHVISLIVYLDPWLDGMRQNLPASGYSVLLVCVVLAIGAQMGAERLKRPAIAPLLLGIVGAMWVIPQLAASVKAVNERMRPVTYAAFTEWAGTTLPTDPDQGLIVADFSPFSSDWSCYAGPHHPAVRAGDLRDQSPAEWRDQRVTYAQVSGDVPADDSYFDDLLLIAEFPPPDQADQWRTWRRGQHPHIRIYSLNTMQTALDDLRLGDRIRLAGYDAPQQASAGEALMVRLYWQALEPIPQDYQLYIHMTPADERGTLIAQADAPPTGNLFRPTSTWRRDGEYYLVAGFSLTVPADTPAGAYQIVLGLYDLATGERLATNRGGDALIIPLRVGN